ncbi:SDR family oxidoreductase [Nitrosovibrio tenuis]|uniref:NAD(P)H dehydrogenase (Quinone) n=1 Tax=Nitrosovibrio tenuis TaxID=1233 RepID=A0A1H7NI24_9PROT|nr:SDR family oxidoreductase [Nitrosovibrio tenuis]SEL22991.1 NAD(P)H dehydrogenase (quinone) [Nitrosovibrio tenuis]
MIVITAASGKLGRAVADELTRRVPVSDVRLAARTPAKLEFWKSRGLTVVRTDCDDPGSLNAAFAGADVVFLISSNGPNEVRIRHHKNAIDAARRTGVKRIVYTSFVNPSVQSKFIWAHSHAETEPYLKASGISYTILRDNLYASNLDGLISQARETGTFALPGTTGKVAYITHADIAASAAAVLTQRGHEYKTYELTGPEALDGFEIAAIISEAASRPIKAVDLALETAAANLRSAGLPEFAVEGIVSMYAAAQAGEYATVTHDVKLLSGRPAAPVRAHIKAVAVRELVKYT